MKLGLVLVLTMVKYRIYWPGAPATVYWSNCVIQAHYKSMIWDADPLKQKLLRIICSPQFWSLSSHSDRGTF